MEHFRNEMISNFQLICLWMAVYWTQLKLKSLLGMSECVNYHLIMRTVLFTYYCLATKLQVFDTLVFSQSDHKWFLKITNKPSLSAIRPKTSVISICKVISGVKTLSIAKIITKCSKCCYWFHVDWVMIVVV